MFTILHMDKTGEENLDTARHIRVGNTLNIDGKHFHPRHSLHPAQYCNSSFATDNGSIFYKDLFIGKDSHFLMLDRYKMWEVCYKYIMFQIQIQFSTCLTISHLYLF
jgi:hypothetical protein